PPAPSAAPAVARLGLARLDGLRALLGLLLRVGLLPRLGGGPRGGPLLPGGRRGSLGTLAAPGGRGGSVRGRRFAVAVGGGRPRLDRRLWRARRLPRRPALGRPVGRGGPAAVGRAGGRSAPRLAGCRRLLDPGCHRRSGIAGGGSPPP